MRYRPSKTSQLNNGVQPWAGTRRSNALRRVKHNGRRQHTPCFICAGEIDYNLEYPHPRSCSVQHIKSRVSYPELTWDPNNWAPAHLVCNQSANQRELPPDHAPISTAW